MSRITRIFFLDYLRAFAIALVVILHGSIIYMTYPPDWWYVINPQNSLFFTYLVFLIDVPIMPVMFFVAGYFAMPALAKRGSARFVRDKFTRIGTPWLFGVFFLAPFVAYIRYYTRSVPVSFLEFWTSDFWTVAYEQSVYWFLGVLFFFFIVLALVYRNSAGLRSATQSGRLPSWQFWVTFGGMMSLSMLLVNQSFPVDAWYTRAYILVFQPLRAPLYIGYFILGIYAYLSCWFTEEGYLPRLGPWAGVWLLSASLYLGERIVAMSVGTSSGLAQQIAYAILFNMLCLSSLLAGAALFGRKVSGADHRFWSSLSKSSYGIYYIHSFILYPLAYALTPVSLPLVIKVGLVLLSSLGLSWMFSSLVMMKVPILRTVFR